MTVIVTTTRGQLQEWSAVLEDFTTNTLDFLNLIELSTAVVEHEIVEVVRDWCFALASRALWIQGRFEETHPSNTSAIAAKVINAVRQMAIPFLAFFFHVDDGTGEDLGTMVASPCKNQEASMAVDCVYSLIRQLINQLPRDVELPGKNWKARFESLDGSLETFDAALKILEQLLQQAPDTLLIIIDGVEQVDDSEAQQPVSELLLLLQEMTSETKEERVVKTFYTTAGPSDVLEGLDEDILQCVEAEEGRLKHMKGRLQCIDDLELDSDANQASASESDTNEELSE